MIKFNLLPWREAQRREQKRLFNGLLVLSALCGLMVVLIVSAVNAAQLSMQQSRNTLLQSENKVLDNRLREIKGLRQDIDALKAGSMRSRVCNPIAPGQCICWTN